MTYANMWITDYNYVYHMTLIILWNETGPFDWSYDVTAVVNGTHLQCLKKAKRQGKAAQPKIWSIILQAA